MHLRIFTEIAIVNCFTYQQLMDFAEGTLDPKDHQALLERIAGGCGRCREEADLLKTMVALMRSDRYGEAPAKVVNTTIGLFERLRKNLLPEQIKRRVQAWLAFDSLQQPALAGIRNAKGAGKQLLYKAEGYDIDLRFSPVDPGEFENVMGQILQQSSAAGMADTVVSLSFEGQEVLMTTTDAFGIFIFRNLPPQKKYDLKITLPEVEIHIGEVSPE